MQVLVQVHESIGAGGGLGGGEGPPSCTVMCKQMNSLEGDRARTSKKNSTKIEMVTRALTRDEEVYTESS